MVSTSFWLFLMGRKQLTVFIFVWFLLVVMVGIERTNYTVDEGDSLEVCVIKDGQNDVNFTIDIFTEQFGSAIGIRAIGMYLTIVDSQLNFSNTCLCPFNEPFSIVVKSEH